MQVKLLTGRGYVEGHFYRNPSQLTLALDNASGFPRLDAIVARRSYTAKSIVAAVVKGSPDADPKLPTLKKEKTGIWEDLLGYVRVGGSAVTINPGDVSDSRVYVGGTAIRPILVLRTATAQATHSVPYTAKAVLWSIEDSDASSMHDSTNPSRLVAPVSGTYEINAKLKTATTVYASGMQFGKNGTPDAATRIVSAVISSAGTYSTLQRTYKLNAGDYLEVFSLGQASSLDLTPGECFAEMRKID
jgi:hypothetical protein